MAREELEGEVGRLAEKYAKDRTNYEIEYAKTLDDVISKRDFLEWVENHIFTSVKKAFTDGFNAKTGKEENK